MYKVVELESSSGDSGVLSQICSHSSSKTFQLSLLLEKKTQSVYIPAVICTVFLKFLVNSLLLFSMHKYTRLAHFLNYPTLVLSMLFLKTVPRYLSVVNATFMCSFKFFNFIRFTLI